jgi:Domain of unknown function (DUF4129)
MRTRSMIKPVAMVAAGGLLVAVAVVGTRASGGLELEFRPLSVVPPDALGVVLLIAGVLCFPVLIAGMIVRRRARRAEDGRDLEWLRRLVFLSVLVASVLVLRELLENTAEAGDANDADLGEATGGPANLLWSGQTAVLALVLAGVAVAVLWWRRHRVRGPVGVVTDGDGDRDAAVIRAGQAVLDERGDEPRAAVVGCYAAMEGVLAETGSPRGPAETPQELLHRAMTEGRLAAEPGHRLTELFLTARYSSAEVSAADVAAAREALSSIATGVRQ